MTERTPDLGDVMEAAERCVAIPWLPASIAAWAAAVAVAAAAVRPVDGPAGGVRVPTPEPAYNPCPGPGPEGENL